MSLDLSVIYTRPDGSYVVNNGLYHVPKDEKWQTLWERVDAYAKAHPEVVKEEPSAPAPVYEEPTLEERIDEAYKEFDRLVEKRLNNFAATRRYLSIYTASNARDSHIAKYAAEGAYCYKMWGETYAKCEELLAEYLPDIKAGKRTIPSWAEIESQLPPLVWPE